jgi:hypothetical protein
MSRTILLSVSSDELATDYILLLCRPNILEQNYVAADPDEPDIVFSRLKAIGDAYYTVNHL